MSKIFQILCVVALSISALAAGNPAAKIQSNNTIIAAKLKVIEAKQRSVSANGGKIIALSYRYGNEFGTFKAIGTAQELQAAKQEQKVTKQEIEAIKAEIEALHAENYALQLEINAAATASAPAPAK